MLQKVLIYAVVAAPRKIWTKDQRSKSKIQKNHITGTSFDGEEIRAATIITEQGILGPSLFPYYCTIIPSKRHSARREACDVRCVPSITTPIVSNNDDDNNNNESSSSAPFSLGVVVDDVDAAASIRIGVFLSSSSSFEEY